jgi:hypothetical protein
MRGPPPCAPHPPLGCAAQPSSANPPLGCAAQPSSANPPLGCATQPSSANRQPGQSSPRLCSAAQSTLSQPTARSHLEQQAVHHDQVAHSQLPLGDALRGAAAAAGGSRQRDMLGVDQEGGRWEGRAKKAGRAVLLQP